MRYMYFCPSCNFVGSDEGTDSQEKCPNCGKELYSTGTPFEHWSEVSNGAKRRLIEQWKTETGSASTSTYSNMYEKNKIAQIFTVLAILIFIGAFITGFVYIDEALFMLISWISGFVVGTMFLGFAEIIKLLQAIKDKP